ncbi:response regulator [Alteromonas flava]|uniref:response regulator n=1 Tax=Alteromonas flava TaxID=2048003 RepID=UPI000C2831D4|nr:response regulator [Alteromonas flava]
MILKILSVEDSEINQTLITERLKLRDYEVLQAFDGQQALQLARAEPLIDLILLDIGLPDVSGIEVAQQLRQSATHRDTPIIFLTGHTTPEYQDQANALANTEFYSKPVDFKALFTRISQLTSAQ